jgi:energy-coupling factor transporter transmembrane protein EcfT
MLLFATAAAFWLQTRRDEVIESLIRLRLPLWAVLFLAQGVAIGGLVERRILRVHQAQQARGVRAGPDFLSRVRAFPVVLIPAVVTTLLEADERAPALTSRGFGSRRILPAPHPPPGARTIVIALFPLVVLLILIATKIT